MLTFVDELGKYSAILKSELVIVVIEWKLQIPKL